MHDPKFTPGLAATYLLDATPGRHTQGGELIAAGEGLDLPEFERDVYTGRAAAQRTLVNLMHVVNAAGLCMFGYISMTCDAVPDFMESVTGWDYDLEKCQIDGERIGTPWEADGQVIGGSQGFEIELHAGIDHTRRGVRIGFEFWVVRGHQGGDTAV